MFWLVFTGWASLLPQSLRDTVTRPSPLSLCDISPTRGGIDPQGGSRADDYLKLGQTLASLLEGGGFCEAKDGGSNSSLLTPNSSLLTPNFALFFVKLPKYLPDFSNAHFPESVL